MANVRETATWREIRAEAGTVAAHEPVLAKYLDETVLRHGTLEGALGAVLQPGWWVPTWTRRPYANCSVRSWPGIPGSGPRRGHDLRAAVLRDPACGSLLRPLLFFKGFHALEAHRIAHRLLGQGRAALASWLQSRTSEVCGVDIHPAARVGSGILIDHATGVVIGETAVVGNGVTLLHGVTLGATGKVAGDRHPKIGSDVFLGAGSLILGNIHIGRGARVGAASVVLGDVPAFATVVGAPVRSFESPRSWANTVLHPHPADRTTDPSTEPYDGAIERTAD